MSEKLEYFIANFLMFFLPFIVVVLYIYLQRVVFPTFQDSNQRQQKIIWLVNMVSILYEVFLGLALSLFCLAIFKGDRFETIPKVLIWIVVVFGTIAFVFYIYSFLKRYKGLHLAKFLNPSDELFFYSSMSVYVITPFMIIFSVIFLYQSFYPSSDKDELDGVLIYAFACFLPFVTLVLLVIFPKLLKTRIAEAIAGQLGMMVIQKPKVLSKKKRMLMLILMFPMMFVIVFLFILIGLWAKYYLFVVLLMFFLMACLFIWLTYQREERFLDRHITEVNKVLIKKSVNLIVLETKPLRQLFIAGMVIVLFFVVIFLFPVIFMNKLAGEITFGLICVMLIGQFLLPIIFAICLFISKENYLVPLNNHLANAIKIEVEKLKNVIDN